MKRRTDCLSPLPDFPNGKYHFDAGQNYTHGETVEFTCDPGAIPRPDTGRIECTTMGWKDRAACLKGSIF